MAGTIETEGRARHRTRNAEDELRLETWERKAQLPIVASALLQPHVHDEVGDEDAPRHDEHRIGDHRVGAGEAEHDLLTAPWFEPSATPPVETSSVEELEAKLVDLEQAIAAVRGGLR